MPEFTFRPAVVLVEGTTTPAAGATGVLRVVEGGDPVALFDLNDSPLPAIRVGELGVHQAFKADIPVGVLDFGSVQLVSESVQFRAAGTEARSIAIEARNDARVARARFVAAGNNPGTPRPDVPEDVELLWGCTSQPAHLGPNDYWVQVAGLVDGGTPVEQVTVAPAVTVSATAGDATATVTYAVTAGSDPLGGVRVGYEGPTVGDSKSVDLVPLSGSHTFTGLTNGSAYRLYVQPLATNGQPVGTPPAITVTPSATTPTVATTLTVGSSDVTSSEARLTWNVAAGNDGLNVTGVRVGRDGNDTDGSGPFYTNETALSGSRLFTKLTPDTFYNLSADLIVGGVAQGKPVTTAAKTAAAATTTPPPTTSTRAVPLIGKSGKPWNTGVFYNNSTAPTAFESWLGQPVDGTVWFNTRTSWTSMKAVPSRRSGDFLCYTTPPFPEGGSYATLIAGGYDADIRAWAQVLINAGLNDARTIIRLAWEWNVDHYWGARNITAAQYVAGFQRFVTQAKSAGLTGVLWDWNSNKGPQSWASYSFRNAYPGDGYVDIISIDPYDHWTASKTNTEWTSNTTNKNPGLEDVAAFARERGKQIAIPEWGVSHWDGAGGGDNPFYIAKMFAFCKANADILAYEAYFEHIGNPSFLRHRLAGGDPNPNAAAEYRKAYPNGWG